MAIYRKQHRHHAFDKCAPCQEKFKQDAEALSTTAKPLNYPSGSEDFKLGATEKVMFSDWTAHAFPSMTGGKGEDGIEGSVSHLKRKKED